MLFFLIQNHFPYFEVVNYDIINMVHQADFIIASSINIKLIEFFSQHTYSFCIFVWLLM